MVIKVMAAFFAAYEAYKLLNARAFSALIERMKAAGRLEKAPEIIMTDFFFRRVLLIELAYLVFAFILLFTAYWYFSIVLITISIVVFLMDTTVRAGRLALGAGSAILAALLMFIVMA